MAACRRRFGHVPACHRQVDDQAEDDREEQRAGHDGAQAEATAAGRLGEVVADGGAQRAGEDEGDPEALHRVQPEGAAGDGDRGDGQGEQDGGEPVSEAHALGHEVARRGAQCEGEEHGRPVAGLAVVVSMLWVERVRFRRCQTTNTTARRSAKTVVLSSSGRPMLSVRLSLISVPT